MTDPHWFNYLLAIWPNKPEKDVVPQYVLDCIEIESTEFVREQNSKLTSTAGGVNR